MARSFTNVKALSALLVDGFSNTLTRRGYAATAQSATRGGATSMSGKMGPKTKVLKIGPSIESGKLLVQRFRGSTGSTRGSTGM